MRDGFQSSRLRFLLPALALMACKEKAPTWDDASVEHRWAREGYGEGFALVAVDLDGDGSDEVIYGGRGLAAVHAGARARHTPLWELAWPKDGPATRGGDNDWVHAVDVEDINGDGVADLIVIDSREYGYGVDGATGDLLWTTALDADFLTVRMALFDADGDAVRDFFPSGGRTAYSGRTGEALWSVDTPMPISFITPAELDGEPGQDVLLVREIDEIIGPFGHAPGTLTEPEVAVYAYTGDGTLLWSHAPVRNPLWATAADLDGDGVHEAVIALQDGLEVVSSDGSGWWREVEGLVLEVLAVDVDGDGTDEILAVVGGWQQTELQVWSGDGTLRLSVPLDGDFASVAAFDLDGDGLPEALVGTGVGDGAPAFAKVSAIDLREVVTKRVRWEVDTHTPSYAITRGHIDGADVVLIGGRSTRLQAVDPDTGVEAWVWTSGHFVTEVAAIDLDGDGIDEVLSGDAAGHLIASSGVDGSEIWSVRLDVGSDGHVTGIAVGDVDGDGVLDIVVTATRYYAQQGGLVARYDLGGQVVFSEKIGPWIATPSLADLDGDGTLEIVMAEEGMQGCGVRVHDTDGSLAWREIVGACIVAFVATGDADGDGTPEIAYADNHWALPVHAAMLSADGAVLWKEDLMDSDSNWVAITEGGLLHGGWGLDHIGHVTRRALSDGAIVWRHALEDAPDPEGEHWRISGGSMFGAHGPDVDGDGTREIITSNHIGDARLLDGATGEALWVLRIEEEGLPWNERHEGFAAAYVPATETAPAWFALGEFSLQRSRSRAVAVDLDGAVLGTWDMDGWGASVVPTSFGAVIGGGLGVHALETR